MGPELIGDNQTVPTSLIGLRRGKINHKVKRSQFRISQKSKCLHLLPTGCCHFLFDLKLSITVYIFTLKTSHWGKACFMPYFQFLLSHSTGHREEKHWGLSDVPTEINLPRRTTRCCDFLQELPHTQEHVWFAPGADSQRQQPLTSPALQVTRAGLKVWDLLGI